MLKSVFHPGIVTQLLSNAAAPAESTDFLLPLNRKRSLRQVTSACIRFSPSRIIRFYFRVRAGNFSSAA
jgi:hypothetical protein